MKHNPSKEVKRSNRTYTQTCMDCNAFRIVFYSDRSHTVHPWYADSTQQVRQPTCPRKKERDA